MSLYITNHFQINLRGLKFCLLFLLVHFFTNYRADNNIICRFLCACIATILYQKHIDVLREDRLRLEINSEFSLQLLILYKF